MPLQRYLLCKEVTLKVPGFTEGELMIPHATTDLNGYVGDYAWNPGTSKCSLMNLVVVTIMSSFSNITIPILHASLSCQASLFSIPHSLCQGSLPSVTILHYYVKGHWSLPSEILHISFSMSRITTFSNSPISRKVSSLLRNTIIIM